MSEIQYWIALSMLQDIGPVKAKRLLAEFKTPERIFNAKKDEIFNIDGIGSKHLKHIKDFSAWDIIEKQMKVMSQNEIKAVHYHDPLYPELLRETDDAPIVLYIKGEPKPLDRYAIAMIGSRKPTDYGTVVTEMISDELASMGFTIVSGMARGIDSLAHKGALGSGGRTIAVLGSGIDKPYPPENRTLMEKIAKDGYVLSEFPPGTPPDKENFPRRNRLISGLSLGVLVIEATPESGSLITAGYAIEHNREVFAVPGNITSANSHGTNKLIKNGAVLTSNARDIVAELAPVLKGFIKMKDKAKINITNAERELCAFLSGEPKQIDIISRESGLPASKALGLLLGLELKGAVKQITGKRFYLA